MRNRKVQIITMVSLAVAVLLLGIGFAAFSNTLKISSNLTVVPDSNTFKVVFSSKIDAVDASEIVPIKIPTTLDASNGVIDNTTTPTITNLGGNFTAPGQKAVYNFYVYNAGEYTAYLNSIRYNGSKKCTAGSETAESLVQAACDGIKLTVSVGETTATDTTLGITGEALASRTGDNVQVTIEYEHDSVRADGLFSVTFPDISLYYATVAGINEPEQENKPEGEQPELAKACMLTDINSNKVADVGEMVVCDSESFYVMPNHEKAPSGTISMLAEYNITNTTTPIQDSTDTLQSSKNAVAFSSSAYWGNVANNTFVYNDSASISTYVNAYKQTLLGKGLSADIVLTLPSYNQLTHSSIGCSPDSMICAASPSWVYATSYWVGSNWNNEFPWCVATGGAFGMSYPYTDNLFGVRPIVIVPESEIGI